MSTPVRRRSMPLFRLLMLVVVALGTAGGALASALGDLHELSHADHSGTPHGSPEADTGHDDEDAGARLLHALVHCGHCHGQGGVLPFAAPAWELRVPPASAHSSLHDIQWRPAPPESLLRPPIRA